MSKNLKIINARLIGSNKLGNELHQVVIQEGKITNISPSLNNHLTLPILDLAGDWLSQGGIDLQINGGLGLAFPDLENQDLPRLKQICDYLWQKGVDGFLPTIVTTSIDKIQRSLSVISQYITTQSHKSAKILGVHLEGPFLNYAKRGAHPEQHLLPLTIENIQQVLGDYSHIVRIMTLAPELDLEQQVIPYLCQQDIIVSLGHSLATKSEAQQAFRQGASMVTHAFNAMPSLHHREPGLLGAAIVEPTVSCGLIADGNHVCPIMLEIILKASNYEQGLFLVSDALAPIGLADGVYPWDERQINVSEGTARLADGTLSGTTLPLLKGVTNLVRWGCPIPRAITLATEAPRQAIGLDGLGVGTTANFLRWHWDERQKQLAWSRID